MSDEKKTKKQLIAELQEARQRLQAVEATAQDQSTIIQNAFRSKLIDIRSFYMLMPHKSIIVPSLIIA